MKITIKSLLILIKFLFLLHTFFYFLIKTEIHSSVDILGLTKQMWEDGITR